MQLEHSWDRVTFSILMWIEYAILCGIIIGFWLYGNTPFDLNIPLFISIVSCIFLIGHIIEWRYHISYPFSEIHSNYNRKNTLFYLSICLLALGALSTIVFYTFKFHFTKIFLVCISIFLFSLITIFIATITEGIRNLFSYCKKICQKSKSPRREQESDGLIADDNDQPRQTV